MKIGILVIALLMLGSSRSMVAQDTQAFAIDSGWVIGPNDSISIVAIGSDDLSKSWRISSTGDLTLPLVGRIHAATKETTNTITETRYTFQDCRIFHSFN